jgi:transposase
MKTVPCATVITLSTEERAALEALSRSTKGEARMRFRAGIVLLAADGMGTREIGRAIGCTTGTASKWRVRYARDRLAGLAETGERGAAPKYGPAHQKRILAMLDQPPPSGYSNWTAPLLARALIDVHEQYIWRFLRAQKIDLSGPLIARCLGDVDVQYVWRVLRAQKLDLAARKSWCESADPEFVAKAAEIVGLYMAPPENAVVLSVDEKPSIQALERAQGYLKLPTGRAMIGQSHDYKRHGTTTLFAALEVATGKVVGRHYQRRRRIEFLDFMNSVVSKYPDKEIHVILDNLSTHKPKRDLWLARHPNVHLHYTPTHTSWLNQIEIWFSILSGKSLNGASFKTVEQLKTHINAFIADYNEQARPFAWTKSKVHQKRLKPCFADQ